jgi:hypothetical protein
MSELGTMAVVGGIWLVLGSFGALVIATLRMVRAPEMPLVSRVDPGGTREAGYLRWIAILTGVLVLPVWGLMFVLYLAHTVVGVWQAVTG